MVTLQYTLRLDAPPDTAWAIVGDLAGVDKWIPGCTGVEIDGNMRICTFADGAVQHEEISDYDDDRRSYRYAVNGGPLPLRSNRGRWAVQADEQGSTVVWEAEIEVLDPAQEGPVTAMLEGAYQQVLELLRKRVAEAQQ